MLHNKQGGVITCNRRSKLLLMNVVTRRKSRLIFAASELLNYFVRIKLV